MRAPACALRLGSRKGTGRIMLYPQARMSIVRITWWRIVKYEGYLEYNMTCATT